MARTWIGTVFCSTVATDTGAAVGAAVCAFSVAQPASRVMARSKLRLVYARVDAKLFRSPVLAAVAVVVAVAVLVAVTVLRRVTIAIRFWRREHATKPDVCQLGADCFRLEILVHPAAENLLHEVVVEDHPHEAAGSEQRIHPAKGALFDAALDVPCQDVVIPRHVGLEEA